jgi:hypothetical protein
VAGERESIIHASIICLVSQSIGASHELQAISRITNILQGLKPRLARDLQQACSSAGSAKQVHEVEVLCGLRVTGSVG